MIRGLSLLAALCVGLATVAGCDQLGKLLGSGAVGDLLKDAGISISYVDPGTGKESAIKREDVTKVTTRDGTLLREGQDYTFGADGQIVFKNLKGPQDFVVTRKDGIPFPINVDPDKGPGQKIGFVSDNGAVVQVPEGQQPEEFFDKQRQEDSKHRVTFHFPAEYGIRAGNVLGIGHRVKAPPGSSKDFATFRFPDMAWTALDNAIEIDVQALGPKSPPEGMPLEDLKARVWVVAFKKDKAKLAVSVIRFRVDQDLERAEMPQPGQDPSTIKLPDKQDVAEGKLNSFEAAEWADEDTARREENVQDPSLLPPA